jgi:hypothetical protein
MKIYIYKLKELEKIMDFFEYVPPEMDLYDLFLRKLKLKYKIVSDIDEADIAFIPIDYVKLIYGRVKNNTWDELYKKLKIYEHYSELTPDEQPPTFGMGYKENYIRFFWFNFVKEHIITQSKIPHFILYSYVLFETSFEPIDKNIFILSYEYEVSFFNTIKTFKIGTYDRIIPIPYVLNKNISYSLPLMDEIVNTEKVNNLTFIGSLISEQRPLIKRIRNFVTLLDVVINIGDMSKIEEEIMRTKYLFVLRGDTPTRISFYQCLVYNVVPIIFEEELLLYQKIFTKDVDLEKSCLVLPNKNEISDIKYSKTINKILEIELSNPNNYLNRIKNHKNLFKQINYFSEECQPIEISLKKIISRGMIIPVN